MTTQIIFCKIITKSFTFHYHGEDDDQKSKAAALKAKVELDVLAYFESLYSMLKDKGIKYVHNMREDWRDTTYGFNFKTLKYSWAKKISLTLLRLGTTLKSAHATKFLAQKLI